MSALGDFAVPAVHAVVERIAKKLMHARVTYLVASARAHAELVHLIGQFLGRVYIRGIEFEHSFDDRCLIRIEHVDFVSLLADGFVAERRLARQPALRELFFLAFLHVLGKESDVVLGRGYFDAPHKPLVRLGVLVERTALFDEVDGVLFIGQYPLVDDRHVGKVAREAVGRLDEDRVDLRLGHVFEHLVEYLALDFASRRFLDGEYLDHLVAVAIGIVVQELFLRRKRVTGILLILG